MLQAFKCVDSGGRFVDDLSRATRIGTVYGVDWVDVPDRDARTTPVRKQFADGQVTRARKLEGMWWADGGAYVVSSYARAESPGAAHDGQVWFYDPKRRTLTLKVLLGVNANPDADGAYDGPDNITVSPYGGSSSPRTAKGSSTSSAPPTPAARTRSPATTSTAASSPASSSRPTATRCSPTSRTRASCSRSPAPGAASPAAEPRRRETGRGLPGIPGSPPSGPVAQSAWAAGFTMPRTVRDFTNSPIAVISHSPENCLISFAIITPVCGSAVVRSKRTSSSPVAASISRQ